MKPCVLSCLLLLFSKGLCAEDRFSGLDDYVAAAMQRWEVPGLALAVVKDGEVVIARGYGLCELGQGRKVTKDTVFTVSSCTKSFVATCVAMLVEEGKLQWDDPVTKHLADFELADPYLTRHVTLRDLATHRTGLRRADLLADGAGLGSKEIMRRLKLLEPIAELRTRSIYNNHMYLALSEVVARVSGQSLEHFASQRIFRPLHMESTAWNLKDVPPDRIAPRHWRSDAGIVARPSPNTGGGIYSTANDMAQWVKLQLAEGTHDGQRLLQQESVRDMHALHFSIPLQSRPAGNIYAARFYGSGLGWLVQDYRGRKVVSHGGSWGAMVAMIPEENLGVVVLSNLDLEVVAAMLMHDVFDAYLVGPHVAWDQSKWEATWLRTEPPGYAYRPRDEAKARMEASRVAGTKPTRQLQQYAGMYESQFYGSLIVRHEEGGLLATFGEFTTPMSHWQDESFYVRTPTRLTFDWLLTFGASGDGRINTLTVKHVGWDKDEKDHVFTRMP